MSRWRLAFGGLLAAVLVVLAGVGIELWQFGPTDEAAMRRVTARVQRRFQAQTSTLARVDALVASNPVTVSALEAAPDDARPLFDLLDAVVTGTRTDIAMTVYDTVGVARAWKGRPSDITPDRIGGTSAFFVSRSPLGLRLVHVQPVLATDGRRLGAVASEQILSPAAAAAAMGAGNPRFTLSTAIADVSVRLPYEGTAGNGAAGVFTLVAPSGTVLAEAAVDRQDVADARRSWRFVVAAAVVAVGGILLLLVVGPLLDERAVSRSPARIARLTLHASLLIVASAGVWWGALALAARGWPDPMAGLLVGTLAATALATLWTQPAARRRLAYRGHRRDPADNWRRFLLAQLTAGALVAAIVVGAARLFGWIVEATPTDLRHFSLHPWSAERVLLFATLLALALASTWAATLVLTAWTAPWRIRRGTPRLWGSLFLSWTLPAVAVVALALQRRWALPPFGVIAIVVACGMVTLGGRTIVPWYRHATMGARILVLFVAFLVPAVLVYPTLSYYTERETRRLIMTQYAPEAQQHVERLKQLTDQARAEIDAMTVLPDTIRDLGPTQARGESAGPELAFDVWRQTVLAGQRLTSAVELYDATGALISRFGLNFPEYSGSTQRLPTAPPCRWDLFGEAQPFGSEERNMLHAERSLCLPDPAGGPPQVVGSIVLHVMFDYRSLPFISSQSPYFELFRSTERRPGEGTQGGAVEVAIYGWGLHPIYASGRTAWSIDDDVFARIYDVSRTPFWTRIVRGDNTYEVFFSSDRSFIYALGYPVLSAFDRFVHVAELMTLAGAAFAIVLAAMTLFGRLARAQPADGRALLREIRASFYRKLFLAFVLASVIPVLTLAFVIRAYFADLLRDAVQEEAARTAAVAQRIIQQSTALWRRDANEIAPGSDDVMVSIAQIIDQDVNIYEGAQLSATSERDLFSSGLLPTRTPAEVYRAIVLDRKSSFVGEDRIGTFTYMIAAAPVRAGERDAMVTVPLANRQREIDREIDDLDRGVHLAALCFILAGAGIGLWLAERIADPVRRLTRATGRIAAGDFDARIAVRSADELRRLVDAFNGMAAELKAQQGVLERTHRLEAWAEMARQVAHEIKNPLTPIQLSAEHLRRVHADRGQPLSPVLEHCVDTILGQVRLLRQISSDFSSFASSPIARPVVVDLPPLVDEVVAPYRTGLAGRISIENQVVPPLPAVDVDPTLVARALVNVIENALHAMPGEGRLRLEASVAEGAVTIAISDTGLGMDADALARIFEPYFSTKTSGTGLGMSIARRNIELNGGTIAVGSEKGVGTRVTIRLPVAPAR